VRTTASLTFRERATLGWGKVRRFCLAHFRPGYVRESLARRVGQCDRTGACCHLMFTCPLLDRRTTPVRCTIHEIKPKVCRLFPIDERDLRDRNIISPDVPCGFSFVPREEFLKRGDEAMRAATGRLHVEAIDLPRE
jgi:Fe-S-cluster containining protein